MPEATPPESTARAFAVGALLLLGLAAVAWRATRPAPPPPDPFPPPGRDLALGPLDLNVATAEALAALPGVGPTRAEAIVADRAANGIFRSVDELDRVPGFGPATVAALRPYVTVGLPAAGPPAR